ncbi:MAG: hypothetical protein JNJ57_04590 [Saprospiraceae bacterium]|nr:hypothetical protein [Saprospiraceae bacterium]
MKKIMFLIIWCTSTFHFGYAQNDEEIDINSLNAPATPAATLLGFSASEIDKPRDASAFLASIVTQTDGLNNLPSNYAFEIAPAWLFNGTRKKITFEKFESDKNVCTNFWHSLSLSGAVRRTEESDDHPIPMTQVAWGIKFSLKRGEFSNSTTKLINGTKEKLSVIHRSVTDALHSDTDYQKLNGQILELRTGIDTTLASKYRLLQLEIEKEDLRKTILDGVSEKKAEALKAMKKDLNETHFNRTGFKLDLTAGLVQDFPNDSYEHRSISKFGAWITTGFEDNKGNTFLGIGRLLQCPDAMYKLDTNLLSGIVLSADVGIRYVYAPPKKPWSLSAEAIYRNLKAREKEQDEWQNLDPTWRYSVTMEYQLNKDLSLNLTFGRNFDGTATRDGNVISLLSLFHSLGNKKPIEKT